MDGTITAEIVNKNVHSDSDVTAEVIFATRGNVDGREKVSKAPIERGSVIRPASHQLHLTTLELFMMSIILGC